MSKRKSFMLALATVSAFALTPLSAMADALPEDTQGSNFVGGFWDTTNPGKVASHFNDTNKQVNKNTRAIEAQDENNNNTSKYFGGGADVKNGIPPSYEIGGGADGGKKTYYDVGSALNGISERNDAQQGRIDENAGKIADNSKAIEGVGKELNDTKTIIGGIVVGVVGNAENIEKNADAIADNSKNIEKNADAIADNSKNIGKNTDAIADNSKNIAKNAGDIRDTKSRLNGDEFDIGANRGNIAHNREDITKNTGNISKNADAIADLDNRAVKYDNKDKNSFTLGGLDDAGVPVVAPGVALHNVADGKAGHDAVNLDQLSKVRDEGHQYTDDQVGQNWKDTENLVRKTSADDRGYTDYKADQTLKSANDYTDSKYNHLNSRMKKLRGRVDAGVAGATAIASMPFDSTPGAKSVAGGLGVAKNKVAGAMGVQYNWEKGYRVRGTIAISDNYVQGGVGFGKSW